MSHSNFTESITAEQYAEMIEQAPMDVQRLVLARLLLVKYSILHDFLAFQLQNYIYACCPISVGGEVSVDAQSKKVVYKINTERFYKLKGKKRIKRAKPKHIPNYKQILLDSSQKLILWTQRILWGPATQVIIYVDGQLIGS